MANFLKFSNIPHIGKIIIIYPDKPIEVLIFEKIHISISYLFIFWLKYKMCVVNDIKILQNTAIISD